MPQWDKMRRIEQRTDKFLKGPRWSLLKERSSLKPEAATDLNALIARMTTVRTARAKWRATLKLALHLRRSTFCAGLCSPDRHDLRPCAHCPALRHAIERALRAQQKGSKDVQRLAPNVNHANECNSGIAVKRN
jgi:hypothetical protein